MSMDESRSAFPMGGRTGSGITPLALLVDADGSPRVSTDRVAGLKARPMSVPEEAMIVDERSDWTPAQMVESKLMIRLKGSSLPVSHLQMRGLLRSRGND